MSGDGSSLRRNARIEEAPLHDELLLFDPDTSRFFVLNQTMSFLWRQCDGQQSLSSIIAQLPQAFADVEADAAEAEFRRAAEELTALGLLLP